MNLHISHDNQFLDYFIRAEEELAVCQNKYVIFTPEVSPRLIRSKKVLFAEFGSSEFWSLIGDFHQYENIYIHWLYGETVEIVNKIPRGINVIWCFWGGDGLEIRKLIRHNYQPKSYRYLRESEKKGENLSFLLSWKIKIRTYLNERNHIRAMRRVNYFAHYLEADYRAMKKATGFEAVFIPFHYASADDIVPANPAPVSAEGNILLGNSDTLTNNHFEAIDLLAQMQLSGRKVYCPLSYWKKEYAHDVAQYGKEKLPGSFIPLLEFMPKEQYDSILASITVAVMNHNRSQAFGNIMGLLSTGAKVFISNKSSLYHYLKSLGLSVFSVQDNLVPGGAQSLEPLPADEIKKNKALLQQYFGTVPHRQKMKKLLLLQSRNIHRPKTFFSDALLFAMVSLVMKTRKARMMFISRRRIRKKVRMAYRSGAPVKIILGAGITHYEGWITTDFPVFNILHPPDWNYFFSGCPADNLLAEHVLEHLREEEVSLVMSLAYTHLKPGGCFRIAVPDAYHPDPEYMRYVTPGDQGHLSAWNIDNISEVIRQAGFRCDPLEYYSGNGVFHGQDFNFVNGAISRSRIKGFKHRKIPDYSSLIIDCYKS